MSNTMKPFTDEEVTTKEALAEMDKCGLRPATMEERMMFGGFIPTTCPAPAPIFVRY